MTQFNLKKLYYNTITYSMKEFTVGMKFEFYYWYASQAVCLDMGVVIAPTDFNIVSATKLEQCSRVLIKCLDNWDAWTNTDELLLGTCSLSSSEDVTVYEYKPVETEFTHYFAGTNSFVNHFCFPGPTPLYSPWQKYPNNFWFANFMSLRDLTLSFKAAWAGLPSYNAAFEGPIDRPNTWEEIYANMKETVTRDFNDWATELMARI